jgi:mannose-1-phosphate guanylyltransferase
VAARARLVTPNFHPCLPRRRANRCSQALVGVTSLSTEVNRALTDRSLDSSIVTNSTAPTMLTLRSHTWRDVGCWEGAEIPPRQLVKVGKAMFSAPQPHDLE